MTTGFRLVRLRSGEWGIRSEAYDEICHPGVGPRAEAEALYVRGLRVVERMTALPREEEFVVWDVGLGGAANAAAVIGAVGDVAGRLRIVSFDHQLEQLGFATRHAAELGYFGIALEAATVVAREGSVAFSHGQARVNWSVCLGDFPPLLREAPSRAWPAPHAILWDPHSPAANPEMWTLPLFRAVFERLDPGRPCALATYSRSTAVRTALLLAGFRVGAGGATSTKEDSTVASNESSLLEAPLGRRWLERASRSHAAEPWTEPPYGGRPLQEDTRRQLEAHPQFADV